MSKNRRRFVPYLGHFGYLMRLSQWFGEVSVSARPARQTTNEAARCEGR
jgi:hypothetical protein